MVEINNKVNKVFKIFYIIGVIIFCGYLVLSLLTYFNQGISLGYLILSIILFVLFYLVTIIFGIINFVQNKNKTVRKNLVIMLVVLLFGSMLAQVVLSGIKTLIRNNMEEKMINVAESLIEKVKNESENKYIYFLDDLSKLDSSLSINYDSGSYVTYFGDEIYICLSDGNYKTSGSEGELEVSTRGILNKSCSYSLSSSSGELYLKYYLEKKYNIDIISVEVVLETVSPLGQTEIDHYNVNTSIGTFEAMVKVVDNKIVVTDQYEEYVNSLNNYDKLMIAIESFTKTYFQVDEIAESEDIGIIQNMNDNYVDIQVGLTKEDAQKYAEALANDLSQSKQRGNVIIRKLLHTNSQCETLSDCINSVENEYTISFSIADGIITWK